MATEFGAFVDPIADKTLIGSALVGLSMLGDLPWWVTVLILTREIGVTVLRLAVIRRGVIPASWGGKLKTVVQAVAIGLFVLPLSGPFLVVACGGDGRGDRADGGHRHRLCGVDRQGSSPDDRLIGNQDRRCWRSPSEPSCSGLISR